MIIHCPECNARYNLTPAQIGPDGRTVRCVKCSHEWFQPAVGEKVEPEQPPLPPINKKSATSKAVAKNNESQTKLIIGIAATVAFIAIGIGAFMFKDSLILPETVIDENTIADGGNQTSNTGLVLGKVNRTIIEDGDLSILVFKGTITNTNITDTEVAPIRVSIYNDQGIELDSFPALPKKAILPPGETTEWVCRFFNPPLDKMSEFRANFSPKG